MKVLKVDGEVPVKIGNFGRSLLPLTEGARNRYLTLDCLWGGRVGSRIVKFIAVTFIIEAGAVAGGPLGLSS